MSWLGSPLSALIGLGGGLLIARHSRIGSERIASAERARAAHARIASQVEKVQQAFLRAERIALEELEPPEPRGPSPDFSDAEGFHQWWDSKTDSLQTTIAMVPEPPTRGMLEDAVFALEYSYGIATGASSRYPSHPEAVRSIARFGFDVASTWLRDEMPSDALLSRGREVRRDVTRFLIGGMRPD